LAAFQAQIAEARTADARLDAAAREVEDRLSAGVAENQARWIAERMALVLQGALLVRHAPHAVADAFCATRLAGDWGRSYGTLPGGADIDAILARQVA
jgi:putative acyl-CoA dehydrogenase